MKRGTKIGWLLVALSLVLSIWVLIGQRDDAAELAGGFIVDDADNTRLTGYTGPGGSIAVPDSIVSIDGGVFSNNASITSVTIPDSVTGMGTGVFMGCENLSSVSIGGGLSEIPANTFNGCDALQSITLPSNISSIGSQAFASTGLTSISIPSSTTSIANDAFDGCVNLTNISVASGNSAYSSSDGCLYNASGSRLVLVPAGKTNVSISGACTTIGTGSFSSNTNISSLTIPSNVTTIEAEAFTGSSISTITIPASVTSIGTQSGWTPSTIYGYADSAAETYAIDNAIPFYVIGENGSTDDPTDSGDGDNTGGGTDGSGDDNNSTGSDGNTSGGTDAGGTSDGTGSAAGTSGGTGGSAGARGGGSVSGGASTTAAANGKDATPKTADGDIDARWFLCAGVFLGGIAVILYSRRRKLEYVSEKKHTDLDS